MAAGAQLAEEGGDVSKKRASFLEKIFFIHLWVVKMLF